MTNIWIYIVGALLVILLLAILWRRIVRAILLLAGLGLAGTLAYALAQQASATKQVATAATVAATGSAAGNVAVALLVGLIVIGAPVGYVMIRRRLAQREDAALWSDRPQHSQIEATQSLNMLVQLEVLHALRELRAPQTTYAPVLERGDDTGDDAPVWW